MFVTDGMLERDAARLNIAAILTASMNMHAREAVQHLTQAVLQASGGQLRDDATARVSIGMAALPGTATPLREQTAKGDPIKQRRTERRRSPPVCSRPTSGGAPITRSASVVEHPSRPRPSRATTTTLFQTPG